MAKAKGKTNKALKLPSRVPVMVLPGAVLFPHTVLPLRIFEPRYRAMLEWALEHDRMFCVATMRPGVTEARTERQFFHTAGLGLVAASVLREDGTSHLILRGIQRVRFTGFPQRRPFRIAEIEPVPDMETDPKETESLVRHLRRECGKVRIDGKPVGKELTALLKDLANPAFISNTAASALVDDAMDRQRLLEEVDPMERLRKLVEIFRDASDADED